MTNKILQRPPKLVHGYKTFKIMVLSAPNVGKTCLVKRFVHDKFNDDHLPTIADTYETGLFLNFDNKLKQFDIEFNDFTGYFKHDCPEIYREKILLSDGFMIGWLQNDWLLYESNTGTKSVNCEKFRQRRLFLFMFLCGSLSLTNFNL